MAFVSDEEYFEIMRKADEARAIQEQEQAAKNQDVIASVRSMVSQEVFEQIKEELNESGEVFDFEIVDEPYGHPQDNGFTLGDVCLLYTSPSPRDQRGSRMPSSA